MKIYPLPKKGEQPPLLHQPYASQTLRLRRQSTVRRAPAMPPVPLPHTLSGCNPMGDLTRQHTGEPIGQRIVVAGRVVDEDGRPVPHTLIAVCAGGSA